MLPSDSTITTIAALIGLLSPFIGLLGVWIGHHLTIRHQRAKDGREQAALIACFFGEIWSLSRLIAIVVAAVNQMESKYGRATDFTTVSINLPREAPPLFGALANELHKLDTSSRTQIMSFYTIYNSMRAHTLGAYERRKQGPLPQIQIDHLIEGWRLVAINTERTLRVLSAQFTSRLPAHEHESMEKVLAALATVAVGKASDPNELAENISVRQ
jgi:hypothetical protein